MILTGGLCRSGKPGRGIGRYCCKRSRGLSSGSLSCCVRRRSRYRRSRGSAANRRCGPWSARHRSGGICGKSLLVLYVRDAKDHRCTNCRDKHERRCNYFDYRKRCHNDHASANPAPPILRMDSAPIWFAHQVQPKRTDCRSTVLTNAEQIGVPGPAPARHTAALRCSSQSPLRAKCHRNATSAKLLSLRECNRSSCCSLSRSSAFSPIVRC